jgi:hypothetical protein
VIDVVPFGVAAYGVGTLEDRMGSAMPRRNQHVFALLSHGGCRFSFGLRSVRLEQRRHVHLVTLHGSLGIVISFT